MTYYLPYNWLEWFILFSIALLHLLVVQCPILSALDAENEFLVQEALERLMEGGCLFCLYIIRFDIYIIFDILSFDLKTTVSK